MNQITIRAEVRRAYKLPARPGMPEMEASVTLQADNAVTIPAGATEDETIPIIGRATQVLREVLEGQADVHVRHVMEDANGENAAAACRASIQEQSARVLALGAAGLNPDQRTDAANRLESVIVATREAHDAIPAARILPRV